MALKLIVVIDIPEVASIRVMSDIELLKKGVRQLTRVGLPRAINRATNKSLLKTRTQARKAIRLKFNLPGKVVNPLISSKNAGKGNDQAYIQGRGSQIPIYKVTGKPKQKPLGVSINTGTGKRIIKHAFIAKVQSGHIGVFKRTLAKGGKRVPYVDTKGRKQNKNLPIRELKFPSPAHMLTQPRFAEKLFTFFTRDYPLQLRKQLNNEFDKAGGRRRG